MNELTQAPRRPLHRSRTAIFGVLTIAALGTWWLLRPDGVRGSDEQAGLPLRVYVDGYGVMVGMDVTFADARDLLSGQFSDGQRSTTDAFFYSNDRDDDVEPEPFPVDVGRRVSVEDTFFPDCGRRPSNHVSLTVQSRLASGREVTNTFIAARSPEYADAVQQWCASGVHANVARSSIAPDGAAEVRLRIANPGPGPVNVEVPPLRVGDVDWAAASRTVAGGTEAELVLRGRGVRCGSPTPWVDGRLTAEGEPVQVESLGMWC